MSEIVQSAIYQLGLEEYDYQRAAAEVAKVNLLLVDSLERVAAEEELVNRTTQKVGDGFAQLEARADRLMAIEQRRANAIAQANRVAEEEGVVANRLAAHLVNVNSKYDAQVAAINRLRGPVQQSTGFMARFGTQIQQAGFQAGDFAVQVASGQSAMVAFTQQGAQLAGFFGGPWGAVAGAVVGTVGAMAIKFLDLSSATDKAMESQERFNSVLKGAYDAINDIAPKFEASQKALINNSIGEATEELRKQEAILREMAPVSGRGGKFADSGYGDQIKRVVELREQLEELKKTYLEIGHLSSVGPVFAGQAGVPGSGTKPTIVSTTNRAAATSAIEEQRSALSELLRVAANENQILSATGTSLEALERQRDVETATIQAQSAARRDYNAGLRDSPILMAEELAQVQKITAANYDLARAQEERGKVTKDVTEEAIQSQGTFNQFVSKSADTIGGALTQAITSSSSQMASFGDIGRNVLSELTQLAIQLALIDPIKNWASGGGSSGGGFGGLLSGAASFLGSLFGGGGTSLGVPFGHAAGGPVSSGDLYMVGERGPELFMSDRAGSIVPNHDLGSMMAEPIPRAMSRAGGGTSIGTINVNTTVNFEGNFGSTEEQTKIGEKIRTEIDVAVDKAMRATISDESRSGGQLSRSAMAF